MSEDRILWQIDDGVGIITFNRPDHHNAQDVAFERQYVDTLAEADRNPEVRAVLVTGAGPAFCVGGGFTVCQGPLRSPRGRSWNLPADGHEISPVVAIRFGVVRRGAPLLCRWWPGRVGRCRRW
jgi:enoyl-CoA hydratase/carnithine racemase